MRTVHVEIGGDQAASAGTFGWVPDPEPDECIRPTRFIMSTAAARMAPLDVETALGRLVETVVERLDEANDEDTQRLRVHWQALGHSRQTEADLCSAAASLSLDPYDSGELSDELAELLENDLVSLPPFRSTVNCTRSERFLPIVSGHSSLPPPLRT
jgi:hypothetical protein